MAANVDRYGYTKVANLWADRVTPANSPMVLDAIRERAAIYSRQTQAMLTAFAPLTTEHQMRFALPGYGTLQPLDSQGIPLPVIPAGHVDVAFPQYWGGTAWADDREVAAQRTVEDTFRNQEDAEARDATWLKWHLLAALFTNTARTFVDKKWGNLTIQPLAITSDSATYLRTNGSSSTAQHYVAQAGAVADATFTAIDTLLSAYPGNAGRRIVSFVPSANVAAVEALTTFIPAADPDIRLGSASDVLLPSGSDLLMMGDRVLGKMQGTRVWVVEWSTLPDDYLLNLVDGQPPLRMRQSPEPQLQGFFPEFELKHGAFPEHRFIRYAGFGVANRVAASVTRLGNGTYAIPTGFTAPQAV